MSLNESMLQCYNRSCGMVFDPASNKEDSCEHHPGVPVFHDAYKKWSCCDKKTTDFTEFLNIKGCTKSHHSNIKPPEPEKPPKGTIIEEEVSFCSKHKKQEAEKRPDSTQPTIQLHSSIGASLKPHLDKLLQEMSIESAVDFDTDIKIATPCQNKGCKQSYRGEHSDNETCLHHSGVPIFHEGMKYWSCCVKRTTDFDSFLEQIGCTPGKHKWHKDKNTDNRKACRYDWHQTGGFVIISIYSKCPLPDASFIKANPVKLEVHITYGKDRDIFEEELHLFGVIDVSNSAVTYLGSKVEVKLKKASALLWKDLSVKEALDNLTIGDQ